MISYDVHPYYIYIYAPAVAMLVLLSRDASSVLKPSSFKEKIQHARYFQKRRVYCYQGNIRQDWGLESFDHRRPRQSD